MTGQPTYIELGVPDADLARAFYGSLLGWRPSGSDGPGNVETPTLDVGLHSDDPASELLVFFAVNDLDASLEQLSQLGGTQHGDVHADPEFGRFAVCSDNQGVRFALHQRDH
jgi:predicted enzyme related to lactoylglutathione lyase